MNNFDTDHSGLYFCIYLHLRPEFFLLADLGDFFSDLGSGDEKKTK